MFSLIFILKNFVNSKNYIYFCKKFEERGGRPYFFTPLTGMLMSGQAEHLTPG